MNKPITPYSSSCERNKHPIFEQLTSYLKTGDHVLEIGSGTGQHAEYFAQQRPDITWQPSDQTCYLEGLQRRYNSNPIGNILMPIELNVRNHNWSQQDYDIVFSANTLHIMSAATGIIFLEQVAKSIKSNGYLIIYGPFRYNNQFTSSSNADFDLTLKTIHPDQGIRDFESINKILQQQNLTLIQDIAMPAHNQLIVWQLAP